MHPAGLHAGRSQTFFDPGSQFAGAAIALAAPAAARTPEQVAEAFMEYHALGVSTFLIRGFDPLGDAIEYGRSLLPATRHLFAQRAAAH